MLISSARTRAPITDKAIPERERNSRDLNPELRAANGNAMKQRGENGAMPVVRR
jgi:hypothetical protein